MAGPGGGPSRRSHTKSRKGCKTCKKRHIRCDETFPQCRNCTKHQVRCDYMDNPAAVAVPESPKFPQQPNLLWTPEIEATVELWKQTGGFPFPDLQVYPMPQWQAYSKTELRLIHHLSSISNEMFRSQTSKLTVWSEHMPKFLSIAALHPFVMHSILAFSASHLAWISQSSETRNLAFYHGSVALKGLHESLGNFSKANFDAVLASSLLLAWQATDWRGWSSLVISTKQVIGAMQSYRHESLFADYLAEQSSIANIPITATGASIPSNGPFDQLPAIQTILAPLQRLQPYLVHHEQESKWIDQLMGYLERLRASNPPQTPEEQFSQLYALRKWLFWVPISLLAARKGDIIVLLILAYFYAAALALEPMFPDVGAAFCANLSLPPLEEIIRIINTFRTTQQYNPTVQAALALMDFPQEMATSYRSRKDWSRRQPEELEAFQQSPYNIDRFNLDFDSTITQYSYGGGLSPAFAPSPLVFAASPMAGDQSSPYLEVPRTMAQYAGDEYTSTLTSPPPTTSMPYMQEESTMGFGMPFGYPGGEQSQAQQHRGHPPYDPSDPTSKGKGRSTSS